MAWNCVGGRGTQTTDTYMDTNEKRLQPQCHNLLIFLERATGIEPATLGLGSRCSTS